MESITSGSDVLFILLGGIMVLAMHSGFAFLELGTVRKKNGSSRFTGEGGLDLQKEIG